jgi:adenine-specific DNA methylase
MKEYLDEKLDFLWTEGIRGADFFIAAIGSAIEVFGKYEQITDTSDKEIKVPQLLDDVRKMVSEYAINKVLHGEIGGEISTMTRFYLLWRTAYGQAKVPFDDARKLATSLGVNLEQEWSKGFIRKEQDIVKVLGPEDRSLEEIKEPTEMIDVLHKVLILWRNSNKDEYQKLLDETGFAKSDTFRRVGQAISESLPDIQEKQMLDGFLNQYSSGKSNSDEKQTKLF